MYKLSNDEVFPYLKVSCGGNWQPQSYGRGKEIILRRMSQWRLQIYCTIVEPGNWGTFAEGRCNDERDWVRNYLKAMINLKWQEEQAIENRKWRLELEWKILEQKPSAAKLLKLSVTKFNGKVAGWLPFLGKFVNKSCLPWQIQLSKRATGDKFENGRWWVASHRGRLQNCKTLLEVECGQSYQN